MLFVGGTIDELYFECTRLQRPKSHTYTCLIPYFSSPVSHSVSCPVRFPSYFPSRSFPSRTFPGACVQFSDPFLAPYVVRSVLFAVPFPLPHISRPVRFSPRFPFCFPSSTFPVPFPLLYVSFIRIPFSISHFSISVYSHLHSSIVVVVVSDVGLWPVNWSLNSLSSAVNNR